jgi:ABC-2 type transport system ATP-binding protein
MSITFDGVTKRFGNVIALDALSFEIPSGRLTGILGPNGAGKTTSFRIALGLTRADEGQIDIFGLRVGRDDAEIVKRVGALLEGPGSHKALTARDNLRIAAHELGRGHDQIDELLELVGLADSGRRKVAGFSRGMAQRLGVAAALLGDPDIMFLDEPLDGLDPAGQVAFKTQLREMVDSAGKTIVVSSHDLADIEQLADHVIVIDRGRLVVEGAKADLLSTKAWLRVEVDDAAGAAEVLRSAGFEVKMRGGALIVTSDDGASVTRQLAAHEQYLRALVPQRDSLEDLFLRLTRPEPES